jgi:hypothetical protein
MWDKMAVCLTAAAKYGDVPRQFPMNHIFNAVICIFSIFWG